MSGHLLRTVRLMAKKVIDPKHLSEAIREQLTFLHEDVVSKVDAEGEKSIKKLVKLTKATAPVRSGRYYQSLTYQKHTADWKECSTFELGAKAPHYRLTHLLVHGHATSNGGRTKGDPFLENALNTVLPEYERNVEEALKK